MREKSLRETFERCINLLNKGHKREKGKITSEVSSEGENEYGGGAALENNKYIEFSFGQIE